MQKFELSEKTLETITGGINKNTALKIGSVAGAVAALSVVGICTAICISKKKKKKKQEYTIEIRETPPRKIYPIEEFSCN